MTPTNPILAALVLCLTTTLSTAGDVEILNAAFKKTGSTWSVQVTLRHEDTGWDHYADKWRVTDEKGNILGERILYHPHVNEQPFTRGLSSVKIPNGLDKVYIKAHDKVHGWSEKSLVIDISNLKK